MQIQAKVVAYSASSTRLATLELCYPRIIHGEVMTHRVFSRNAMSSRAIPIKKMLAEVWNDPFVPQHWGQNQPGMQAKEQLTGIKRWAAEKLWRAASKSACVFAWGMYKVGLHKQIGNRVLEPFQWMRTILSATEFDNFFALRDHPDAEPHFRGLARAIDLALRDAVPTVLEKGQWHLPYLSEQEVAALTLEAARKVSAARCARVSYLTHDGRKPSLEEDLALFERLAGSAPIHASPLEHQATPDAVGTGNFKGWKQFRILVESGK
jgi:hypothetical protein